MAVQPCMGWISIKKKKKNLKLTMKTQEERQCFLIFPCKWGCSGGYSCTWICFNTYISIIYFIWCTARYTMKRTRVPSNVTRSTKLRGTQRSPELTFRSMDFPLPEDLIFLHLTIILFLVLLKRVLVHSHPIN